MDCASSVPPPAWLAGGRDEAGRAMGHGHDGNHGVDTRRAGERAPVGDVEALDNMHLVIGTDHGGCRVIAHATGAHLVEAHVAHLAGAVAIAIDFVHKGLDAATLSRAVADVCGLAGEDLLRTGGLQNANAGLDPLAHVGEVGARELVLDPGGAVLRDDPAATATAWLRTIRVNAGMSGWRTVARTPTARPSSITTRSTVQFTTMRARRR